MLQLSIREKKNHINEKREKKKKSKSAFFDAKTQNRGNKVMQNILQERQESRIIKTDNLIGWLEY